MQPGYNRGERQRPLQKSMFLPTSSDSYSNRNTSGDYQYQELNGIKRTSVGLDSNKLPNYLSNQQGLQSSTQQQYSSSNSQILNFNSTPRHKEFSKPNNNSGLGSFHQGGDSSLGQISEKIERIAAQLQSHQEILKKNNLTADSQKDALVESQIVTIESRLKESVLPSLINQSTKEIYEHIFNFKLELQVFKDDMAALNKSIEKQRQEISDIAKEISDPSNKAKLSSQSTDRSSVLTGNEQTISDFSSAIHSIENTVSDLQKRLLGRDEQVRSLITEEIGKHRKELTGKVRSGQVKSSLPSYMIEYQELFVIKGGSGKLSLSSKSPKEDSITLNSCMYFVDKEGYLLDNQNRYIVDAKGMQIRLESEHLSLLKQHHLFA